MFSLVLGGGLNSLNIHQSLSPDRELSKANPNTVCGVVNCYECSHAFNPRISAPAGFPSPISPLLSTARRNGHLHRYQLGYGQLRCHSAATRAGIPPASLTARYGLFRDIICSYFLIISIATMLIKNRFPCRQCKLLGPIIHFRCLMAICSI